MNITPASQREAGLPSRIIGLDELRGLALLSMIGFHVAYDLAYLYGVPLPLFSDPVWQELWRISVSWTFLALAGWMTALSRNNMRRALEYAVLACAIWITTSLANVDVPISFGIIFCMAASTAMWAVIERLSPTILDAFPRTCALISLGLFFILYEVPRSRYGISGFAWLGFPSPQFTSSDYYPIIPFSLLYVASAITARAFKRQRKPYPHWLMNGHIPPLAWMGRHSLIIYALHQPLALAMLSLIMA